MEQSFAEFVAARRSELGISASTFADLVGRSTSTIRAWERGRSRPGDPKTLQAIAAVLDVDEAHLTLLAGGASLPPPEPLGRPRAPGDADGPPSDDDGGAVPEHEPGAPPDADDAAPSTATSVDARERPGWITDEAEVASGFTDESGPPRPPLPLADSRLPWLPLPPAHRVLERTDTGLRYPIRVVATVVAIVLMLGVLAWSLGEFRVALGELRLSMFG